jgi:hypothetical protein
MVRTGNLHNGAARTENNAKGKNMRTIEALIQENTTTAK